jgi:hypothetical protein
MSNDGKAGSRLHDTGLLDVPVNPAGEILFNPSISNLLQASEAAKNVFCPCSIHIYHAIVLETDCELATGPVSKELSLRCVAPELDARSLRAVPSRDNTDCSSGTFLVRACR